MAPDDDIAPVRELLLRGGRPLRPLAFLGRGSTGVVYRVLDEELGEEIALKILHAIRPDDVYRLKREFRSVADLLHDNVVHLYDLVVDEIACFFTMEFVDGGDFVAHVRRSDDARSSVHRLKRFFAAAVQLLQALEAVHAAGRLHRDIKPSNVLVASSGRVVLLDFDLAVPAEGAGDQGWASAGGTLAYMPPEQLWGGDITPQSDLYAVGVMFYEVLTGRLPFEGPPAALVAAKTRVRPPSVRMLAPEVPEPLGALVLALLDPTAANRPSLVEVVERLRAELPIVGTPAASTPPPVFVGREREMANLIALANEVRRSPIVIRVFGESGIGKTELVHRALAETEATTNAVVLRGRCLPQESVPYKALDMLVDGLSRLLLGQPEPSQRAMLTDVGSALARLFPVLARVPGVVPLTLQPDGDLVEVRRRAVEELCRVLSRIAATRPLALWIDDLHWGDLDSAGLLAMLLRSPIVPPIALFLSYRVEEPVKGIMALLVDAARDARIGMHDLALEPLDGDAARHLAARVCPSSLRTAEYLDTIAVESRGLPFMLTMLGRHLARPDGFAASGAPLALSDFVRDAVGRLSGPSRRVVELVAVSGGPLDRGLVMQLCGQGERARQLIASLEREGFIRITPLVHRVGIDAQHDRIREAVVQTLVPERRAVCHRDLARALEATGGAEPELLAHHFHAGGLSGRAADYAVVAADRASATLAFLRAAELYRLARIWDPRDAAWERGLHVREAEALANAAHFVESADSFMAAAKEAVPIEALDLRRQAVQQLLAAGRLDEGLTVLHGLLRDLGLQCPEGPGRMLLAIAVHILGFRLRGTPRVVPTNDLNRRDLLRVDTCYSAAKSLVDADPIRGVYFSVQALRHAWRLREPERLGRSLCLVGGSVSASGDPVFARIGAWLMARARQIARQTDSAQLHGTIAVAEGQVLMLQGRWKAALGRSEGGVALLEGCRDSAAERTIGHFAILRALEDLGDFPRLTEWASALLQRAAATRNWYAGVYALHQLVLPQLAFGDLAGARAIANRSGDEWTQSGFHIQHLYRTRAEAHCDLWAGDPEAALERVRAIWWRARRAQLFRIALARIDARYLRARACLQVFARTRDSWLLSVAARDARRLARERRGDATGHAAVVRAGIAQLTGDRSAASAALSIAEAAYQGRDMVLYAACAAYRRGQLLGGARGRRHRQEATAQLEASGVRDVERWIELCAPGFPASTENESRIEGEVGFGTQRTSGLKHDLDEQRALDPRRPR